MRRIFHSSIHLNRLVDMVLKSSTTELLDIPEAVNIINDYFFEYYIIDNTMQDLSICSTFTEEYQVHAFMEIADELFQELEILGIKHLVKSMNVTADGRYLIICI